MSLLSQSVAGVFVGYTNTTGATTNIGILPNPRSSVLLGNGVYEITLNIQRVSPAGVATSPQVVVMAVQNHDTSPFTAASDRVDVLGNAGDTAMTIAMDAAGTKLSAAGVVDTSKVGSDGAVNTLYTAFITPPIYTSGSATYTFRADLHTPAGTYRAYPQIAVIGRYSGTAQAYVFNVLFRCVT